MENENYYCRENSNGNLDFSKLDRSETWISKTREIGARLSLLVEDEIVLWDFCLSAVGLVL